MSGLYLFFNFLTILYCLVGCQVLVVGKLNGVYGIRTFFHLLQRTDRDGNHPFFKIAAAFVRKNTYHLEHGAVNFQISANRTAVFYEVALHHPAYNGHILPALQISRTYIPAVHQLSVFNKFLVAGGTADLIVAAFTAILYHHARTVFGCGVFHLAGIYGNDFIIIIVLENNLPVRLQSTVSNCCFPGKYSDKVLGVAGKTFGKGVFQSRTDAKEYDKYIQAQRHRKTGEHCSQYIASYGGEYFLPAVQIKHVY